MREIKVWLLLFFSASLGLTAPIITFKDPIPPDNGRRVFEQMCSGQPQHLGDCTFDLSDMDITAVITPRAGAVLPVQTLKATLMSGNAVIATLEKELRQPSRDPVEFELNWAGTKAVSCNAVSTVVLTVEAKDLKQPHGAQQATVSLTHNLICNTCVRKTDTKGNGDSEGGSGSPVRVQFLVTNLDDIGHTVVLSLDSTRPWTVSPALPSSIELASGESREFPLVVTIAGGEPPGSVNEITLVSELLGVPASASSDTVRISVVPLVFMPTLSQWGLMIFILALAGVGWFLLLGRSRRAGA